MSRSVPWRRTCPEKILSRIERTMTARIYLLRATGPTGFLLAADGDEKKYKVDTKAKPPLASSFNVKVLKMYVFFL